MRSISIVSLLLSMTLIGSWACLVGITERPIVVIIPSYNNQKWCEQNIRSVLNQKYSNYRIIYIDDCSTDATRNLVRMQMRKYDIHHRITLITNTTRYGALANIYKAVHSCADGEIVCTVDGDDWLKDDQVLATLNQVYADPNVWMTYGQFEGTPGKMNGFCRDFPPFVIEHNAFRDYDWVSSHLRTFYAGLFKRIRLQDLIDSGDFFDVTWDLGFMFPMLEMARERHKCIYQILYVYNIDNPLNDFRIKLLKQWRYERMIRSFERYQRIDSYATERKAAQVDMLMVSDNKPERLQRTLHALRSECTGVGQVYLVYSAATDATRQVYEQLAQDFGLVSSVWCEDAAHIQPAMRDALQQMKSSYVACVHDDCVIVDAISFASCVTELEKTHAHGFYLSLGADVHTKRGLRREQKVPPLVVLSDSVRAWQLKDGEHDWRNPFSCSMAVYRTADFKERITACACDDVTTLYTMLATESVGMNTAALCYVHAPVVGATV